MNLIRAIKNMVFAKGTYSLIKHYYVRLGKKGKNVVITPPMFIGNKNNLIIGDNVGIGQNCYITATNAKVIIKGNCAIAENLTIHTGNHARVPGMFVTDINDKNKPAGYDSDVIIENDCWVGANVTILAGVHVGRGATIAAGAVVTKDVPPYSIVGGVPAKVLKFYWDVDQIMQHEQKLYSENERMKRQDLEMIIKNN